MEGCESLGSVCRQGRNGSVIEVARIEGKIFKTMKQAEAHGLQLARGGWMRERKDRFQQFQREYAKGAEPFGSTPSQSKGFGPRDA
jgi:hypothetical protein